MKKNFLWFFLIIAGVYFLSIGVDTMDGDASQYAEVSRSMSQTHDYTHLYYLAQDYLDKPPFLFWMSSLSMRVFGVNNFGYKIPSILFALWAIFATWKLAKLLYDEKTAWFSAVILATSQGMFLMTNDIRCDTILMSWTVTAIWLIQEWVVNRKLYYLLLGSVSIAFGMMTKGPIALMVPVFCFASNWVLHRQWKNFFYPSYILGIIIIGVMLVPMSIGLYEQFDMHPEKGISGLRFYYWSQSFGRITGENPWKNGADFSFLLLNMLWSFQPWIFLFIGALIMNFIKLIKQKLKPNKEWLTMGGFILSYAVLGVSSYQLPHYIFIAFPLAAIVTGVFIKDLFEGQNKWLLKFFSYFNLGISFILVIAVIIIMIYIFPTSKFWTIVWCIISIVWVYFLFKNIKEKLFWMSATGIVLINIFISGTVYPSLLKYQAGNSLGRYIYTHKIDLKNIFIYNVTDPMSAIHFYSHGMIDSKGSIVQIKSNDCIITMNEGIRKIDSVGIKYDILYQDKCYPVSQLTPKFINPTTRDNETKQYYLLKIK